MDKSLYKKQLTKFTEQINKKNNESPAVVEQHNETAKESLYKQRLIKYKTKGKQSKKEKPF